MNKKDLLKDPQTDGGLPEGADYVELASVIDAEKEVIQQAESKILLFAKQLIETDMDSKTKGEIELEMLNIQSQVDQLRESCAKKEQALNEYLQGGQLEDVQENGAPPQELEVSKKTDTQDKQPARATDPTIRIQTIDDNMAAEWNAYVDNHSEAAPYYFYGWRAIAEKTLSANCLYLAAIDLENNLVGILPIVSIKQSRKIRYGSSLPFGSSGGPLADSPAIANRLLWRAAEIANLQGWQHIEITSHDEALSWQSKSPKIRLVCDINPEPDGYALEALPQELKDRISTITSEEPHIETGKQELLGDFYKVYKRCQLNPRKQRLSKAFFSMVMASFPELASFVVAKIDNKPVASALLINRGDMLEILSLSVSRKHATEQIADWFYWELIKHASEHHYRKLDLGLYDTTRASLPQEKYWDAKRAPQLFYYWVKKGSSYEPQGPTLLTTLATRFFMA